MIFSSRELIEFVASAFHLSLKGGRRCNFVSMKTKRRRTRAKNMRCIAQRRIVKLEIYLIKNVYVVWFLFGRHTRMSTSWRTDDNFEKKLNASVRYGMDGSLRAYGRDAMETTGDTPATRYFERERALRCQNMSFVCFDERSMSSLCKLNSSSFLHLVHPLDIYGRKSLLFLHPHRVSFRRREKPIFHFCPRILLNWM